MVRSTFVVLLPAFTRSSSANLCRSVSSAFSHQVFRIPLRICAMEGSVSYPEHILNMRVSEFWMRKDIGFQLAWSNYGADESCNATQITCWTFVPRTACSAVCRHAVVKCSSVVEAVAAEGSKQLFSSSGNTNVSQMYLGKGKIVHGPSCSGEDYKSSLSAGGCLEIHSLKLLAGSSAVSLQVHKTWMEFTILCCYLQCCSNHLRNFGHVWQQHSGNLHPVIYSMQGLRANGYFEFTLPIHYWSLCPLIGIDQFGLFPQLC
jgi:hypothetical protein